MTGSASPSQRNRSPGLAPNSKPKPLCSSSFQAEPMARMARPPLMWSSVVTILATSAGLRYVLAPTMRPTVGRVVMAAIGAMSMYGSRQGP